MRTLRILMASLMLALPLRSEEIRGGSTLKEITRDAQERLKQWDEDDAREQAAQARYWWVGLIELAVTLAFGHALYNSHGITFSDRGGLTLHPARRSISPALPPTPTRIDG